MKPKMTRVELTDEIAQRADLSHVEAKMVLEAILDSMVSALKRGERIELRRFGTLVTRVRRARTARNPRNGEIVQVNAKRVLDFRPSIELLGLLNGGPEPELRLETEPRPEEAVMAAF